MTFITKRCKKNRSCVPQHEIFQEFIDTLEKVAYFGSGAVTALRDLILEPGPQFVQDHDWILVGVL